MGRAARWLRALLGGKKSPPPATASTAAPPPAREKKQWWSFVKSFREKEKKSEASPAAASYRDEDEANQNRRAIAVAVATAAAAEAAVVAAQAAAAVVRLTGSGKLAGGVGGGGKREESAAVKIQSAFRAYLARRALRALKGLVKLQALVRGNIVRKQAAETLRCMHALVRVQARARACRALRSEKNLHKSSSRVHLGPATPEKSEQPVRANARRPVRASTLKMNSSKQTCVSDGLHQDQAQSSDSGWLGQWMENRYSWGAAKSGAVASASLDDEKNAKILEVDTGKPHFNTSKQKCSNAMNFLCSPLASDQFSQSFMTVADSPSKDSTVAQRSIPSPSSVYMQQSLSPLPFPFVDDFGCGESPQFFSASSRPTSSKRGPFMPLKRECSRSLFSGYSDYPNYMANTESSRARARSQSAPKQRLGYEKLGLMRRVSGHGLGQQSGPAAAAVAVQRSSLLHVKFTSKAYPGSGRLDRLGMPVCN